MVLQIASTNLSDDHGCAIPEKIALSHPREMAESDLRLKIDIST